MMTEVEGLDLTDHQIEGDKCIKKLVGEIQQAFFWFKIWACP